MRRGIANKSNIGTSWRGPKKTASAHVHIIFFFLLYEGT